MDISNSEDSPENDLEEPFSYLLANMCLHVPLKKKTGKSNRKTLLDTVAGVSAQDIVRSI